MLHSTVAELRRRMTWREFQEWRAAYAIEPWGEARDDDRIDVLANVNAELQTPKGKSRKWVKFTRTYGQPRLKPQSLEAMKAAAMKITAMMGARRRAERKKQP